MTVDYQPTWMDFYDAIYKNNCVEIGYRLQWKYEEEPERWKQMVEYLTLFVLIGRLEDDHSSADLLTMLATELYIRYHDSNS